MNRRVILASLISLTLGAGWLLLGSTSPAQTEEAKKTPNLRRALDQTVTLDFADLSMEEVAERLHAQTKVPVVLDSALTPLLQARANGFAFSPANGPPANGPPPDASSEEPRDTTTRIPAGFSCQLRQMKLGTALDTFLGHYGLGYALLGDTIVIATANRASELQNRQPVSLTFENVPLVKALDMLAQSTPFELVLDPRCAKEAQAPITIRLRDVPLERGVQLVAELADLKAVALGHVFFVTTPARADALRATKGAPVKTMKIPAQAHGQFPGQSADVGGMGGMMGGMFGMAGAGPPMGGMFGMMGAGPPPERHPGPAAPGVFNAQQQRGALNLLDVEVPLALLQKGGPAPRGLEPEKRIAKVAPAPKKAPTSAEMIRKKLRESMPEAQWDDNLTLGAILNQLEKNFGFPKFVINQPGFKEENPDAASVNETKIVLPNVKGIAKGKVLRIIVDQVPTHNAVFLVRPDYIEITTNERSLPENQFIEGTFQDVPLDEVLAELSDRTGLTILVDARAGEKAITPVSARFQAETNLATAVRLLADMADLKLVIVDRVLYITLRSNAAIFPPGNLPAGKQRRVEAA